MFANKVQAKLKKAQNIHVERKNAQTTPAFGDFDKFGF